MCAANSPAIVYNLSPTGNDMYVGTNKYKIKVINDHDIVHNEHAHTCIAKDQNNISLNVKSRNDDCEVHVPEIELSQLLPLYISDKQNLKFCHININSIRHKFGPLAEVMQKGIIDILSVQETKLDSSFPDQQFKCEGFKIYRKDNKCNSGGLLLYVRNDLAQRRRTELEFDVNNENGRLETICVEVFIKSEKWLILSVYKQPVIKDIYLCSLFEKALNTISVECSNYIIVGDINIDMSKPNKLETVLQTAGCKNVVKQPTCHKSNTPSLIDLVITNVHKRIKHVACLDIGLSDFHDLIYFSTKQFVPIRRNRVVMYRSYRHFNNEKYNKDLEQAPFHVGEIFDDYDDMYYFNEKLMFSIMNEHAPVKCRKIKHNSIPYMNSELRKCINVKNMLRRKFDKCNTQQNWALYRYYRNRVVNLRKQSIGRYIQKCTVNTGSTEFWKTIKPLISDRSHANDNVTLMENGEIVNNADDLCDVMNSYFVNMAKDIGHVSNNISIQLNDKLEDIIDEYKNHDSCMYIKNNNLNNGKCFSFDYVTRDQIQCELSKLNIRKSTGCDSIPPKLLKLGAENLSIPIQYMINRSLCDCVFPYEAKKAEISPIYKKNDSLDKCNYRPVSVLSTLSKIYEKIIVGQLTQYFDTICSPDLSGFRKKHGCQDVILNLVENTKSKVDNNKIVCTVLTDLTRAFDCLPHRLLIAKMYFYGFNYDACKLVMNYLSNRQQRVKLNGVKGEWMDIYKGAPQGSLFGPFAYNLFSNDLLVLMRENCDIYNYADDNTISCDASNLEEVKVKMVNILNNMLCWFKQNGLKANPEKFQMILFGRNHSFDNQSIIVNDICLMNQTNVKLLGVYIDSKFDFNVHVSEICRKAGYKLNVLSRLSRNLDVKAKLLLLHSFILSFFNYCAVAWHFCNVDSTRKIEKIQERALRFIYKDFTSSYESLREESQIPLAYIQRMRQIIIEVYKCYNKISPMYLHNIFKSHETSYKLRKIGSIHLPNCTTFKYGTNSFAYQGAKLWNSIENNVKTLEFKDFKRHISGWIPDNCECSVCILCKFNNIIA